MKITLDSHIGIRLQNFFAAQPATLERVKPYSFRVVAGTVLTADIEAVSTLLELVRLSPADEVFAQNCLKKTYVVTKRAREVIEAIAVSKLLPISRLLPLLRVPRCVCVSPTSAVFLWADQGTVKAWLIAQRVEPDGEMSLQQMSCDLSKVYELLDLFEDSPQDVERMVAGVLRVSVNGLIRLLIFLELTDPEILFVAAGKKHSQAPMGYTNAAGRNVLIVDSTWNKFIVRVEGFGVRGHFRVQPCGVGLSALKLIWIAAFEKKGYVRRPGSRPQEGGPDRPTG